WHIWPDTRATHSGGPKLRQHLSAFRSTYNLGASHHWPLPLSWRGLCFWGGGVPAMRVREDELSVADAAAVLGGHYVTVCRLTRHGVLKSRKRGPYRFPLLQAVLAMRAKARRIENLKASAA